MPLDSKTHRNLGYSFIQFNTIEDLIYGYECVGRDGGGSHVAAGEDVAQVGVYQEMPFLLREDSGRSERGVGRSRGCVEEELGRSSIEFCIFMPIISRKADDFRSLSTLRCCLFGHATRFVFLCIDHFGQLISRGEEKCIGKLLPCSAPRGTSRERSITGIDPLRSNTRAQSSWANCSLSIIIKSYPRVDYVCCA